MYNTFKNMYRSNEKAQRLNGEELLYLELSSDEKELVKSLDLEGTTGITSIDSFGDYLLTMLNNEYYHDGIYVMDKNNIIPSDLVYYVDKNPEWEEHFDTSFFVDITTDYERRNS
jgi:hypothetical protein